jgi:hypothetical protein
MIRQEPAVLLAWTMITAALSFGDVQHPMRGAFALVFLALVPGLTITRVLGFKPADRLLLALPVSVSLAAVISAVLVYSAYPSWDLGLSMLMALTVGAVALDLARGAVPSEEPARPPRVKLEDESRQARLIESLGQGKTLSEAAEAAGVTVVTLQRTMRRSDRLRMAVSVVTHGELEPAHSTYREAKSSGDPRGAP